MADRISINFNNLIDRKELFEFAPFKNWHTGLINEIDRQGSDILVKSITIRQVDRFKGNKVGFIKLDVDAESLIEKSSLPGIVILRGDSVSILFIIESDTPSDKQGQFVILTSQPRLAVPSFNLLELPAGMLDGSGEFQGKAAQELYEETGLRVQEDELVDLTKKLHVPRSHGQNSPHNGILTSPGFTDERLHLFLCRKKISQTKLSEFQGKLTGERTSGEIISLKLIPLEDIYSATCDVKVLASMALYNQLQ